MVNHFSTLGESACPKCSDPTNLICSLPKSVSDPIDNPGYVTALTGGVAVPTIAADGVHPDIYQLGYHTI